MRKSQLTFLIICIIGILISSCKKEKKEDIFTMSFKVDNSAEDFSAKATAIKIYDGIDENKFQIWVRGDTNDSMAVLIQIRTVIETNKTYTFGSPQLSAFFTEGNNVLSLNSYFAKSGFLKVTSLSGGVLEGIFEFTAKNSSNNSKAITQGKFRAKIEGPTSRTDNRDLRVRLP